MAPLSPLRSWLVLLRLAVQSSPAPSIGARGTVAPSGVKPQKRRLPATAGFYVISVVCHVILLALLVASVPQLKAQLKLILPVENIRPDADLMPESVRYELAVDSTESNLDGELTNVLMPAEMPPGGLPKLRNLPNLASTDSSTGLRLSRNAQRQDPKASRQEPVGPFGGARASERAVAAALNWLYRHQSDDGSWNLVDFASHCQDSPCIRVRAGENASAATSLALLPFLGARQSQLSPGPYRDTVQRGLRWLVAHQSANGDLSAPGEYTVYSHALATLVLCEGYSLSHDEKLIGPAQSAIQFIQTAQNPVTGGWDYQPGGVGNLSIFVCQMMALDSAQRAGLKVDSRCLSQADAWLQSVAVGEHGGLFCDDPRRPATAELTAVGLLCKLFRQTRYDNPAMVEGRKFLSAHPPQVKFSQDVLYWYYGTLLVRNFKGTDADSWTHRLRRNLLDTQIKSGCAAGSWDLELIQSNDWILQEGRLLATSLATQLLELEYGYLAPSEPEPTVRTVNQTMPAKR